jgi:hypothetical protein
MNLKKPGPEGYRPEPFLTIKSPYNKSITIFIPPPEPTVMAKAKTEVSKSQSIREFLTENPTAKAKEVVEALGKTGVKVNEGLVYAVKGGMKERKRRKKRVAKAAMAAHSPETPAVKADALTMIRETKALAAKAGGFKKLMELVAALAE